MTAQSTFEQLLEQENKIHEAATLAEVASHPPERIPLIEGFIEASEANRKLLDSLFLSFSVMPSYFKPLIDKFEELRRLMLKREIAWKEIRGQFKGKLPTLHAMNTVSWNCRQVDPILTSIVEDLKMLQVAAILEAFLRV